MRRVQASLSLRNETTAFSVRPIQNRLSGRVERIAEVGNQSSHIHNITGSKFNPRNSHSNNTQPQLKNCFAKEIFCHFHSLVFRCFALNQSTCLLPLSRFRREQRAASERAPRLLRVPVHPHIQALHKHLSNNQLRLLLLQIQNTAMTGDAAC